MSEADIKAGVRARDGHKCRMCDMTNDEHQETHGTVLHVHRLIPGSIYKADVCITLCVPCHGKMPKDAADLVFKPSSRTGIFAILFNLFDPDDRRIIDGYMALAKGGNEIQRANDTNRIMSNVLKEWLAQQTPDYAI